MNRKKIHGITIISLIITIVILLILAGITITLMIDENSLINQTAKTRKIVSNSKVEEEKQVDIMDEIIDSDGDDYIKDDELDENNYLKTFITEWSVNDGDTIVLPIYQKQETDEERGEIETYFNYDFQVDYGDGTITQVKSYDDVNRIHTYKKGGIYNVKINGKCEAFSFNYVEDSKEKITKLIQWGVISAKHYDFASCINLAGEIPLPSKNSFKYVESFRLLFYKCASLTGTIPNTLFKYAPNVISMGNIFNFTTGLECSIPNKLFYWNEKVTNFRYAFAGSNFIGEIPSDLFINNREAKNFRGVFSQCINLTGTLSKDLFKNNTKLQVLSELLSRNRNIKVKELYLSSSEIIEAGGMGIVYDRTNIITIYVPKNSETENTFKKTFETYDNIIVKEY